MPAAVSFIFFSGGMSFIFCLRFAAAGRKRAKEIILPALYFLHFILAALHFCPTEKEEENTGKNEQEK